MENKKGFFGLGASIFIASFADFKKKFTEGTLNKAKSKMKEVLASLSKDWEIMGLDADAESIKKFARELGKEISGIANEKTRQGIEFFILHLSRNAKFKIMKNLSETELEKLASLSDELKDEVKYFRVWTSREDSLVCPKPKTFGELKTLCNELRINIERQVAPCVTVTSSQTKAGYVIFYIESGDYCRGPRIASIPIALLYK